MTTRQSVEDTALKARALVKISHLYPHSRKIVKEGYEEELLKYRNGLMNRHVQRQKKNVRHNPLVR